MKENSIEEALKKLSTVKKIKMYELLRTFKKEGIENFVITRKKYVDVILSDYKRVLKINEVLLKENEELNSKIPNLEQGTEILMEINTKLTNELNDSISKQKIKDIINRIDYDIKKTKEIISKNTNIYASYRKNSYQITRLKAINTKSLDIKKRLQELLESEE